MKHLTIKFTLNVENTYLLRTLARHDAEESESPKVRRVMRVVLVAAEKQLRANLTAAKEK